MKVKDIMSYLVIDRDIEVVDLNHSKFTEFAGRYNEIMHRYGEYPLVGIRAEGGSFILVITSERR